MPREFLRQLQLLHMKPQEEFERLKNEIKEFADRLSLEKPLAPSSQASVKVKDSPKEAASKQTQTDLPSSVASHKQE